MRTVKQESRQTQEGYGDEGKGTVSACAHLVATPQLNNNCFRVRPPAFAALCLSLLVYSGRSWATNQRVEG